MLALRVQINEGEAVTGGAEDLAVLTASVSFAGRLGPKTDRGRQSRELHGHCHLGGLTSRGELGSDEHLDWISLQEVKVGDRIVIEVIETDDPSPVIDRRPHE